jgi:ADP-ribose pyrophosphatase
MSPTSVPSHPVQRPPSRQPPPAHAKCVFRGVLFDVWQWQQNLFDGSTTTFETIRRPDTVLILPVTGSEVILAEETQPGRPTVLKALGGRINPGESPENAAARELLEEAGYRSENLRLWDAWQPAIKLDWAVYIFIAHSLVIESAQKLDPGEQIKLKSIGIDVLLDGDSTLPIDDYVLLHKLYHARSSHAERLNFTRLLETPNDDLPPELHARGND